MRDGAKGICLSAFNVGTVHGRVAFCLWLCASKQSISDLAGPFGATIQLFKQMNDENAIDPVICPIGWPQHRS